MWLISFLAIRRATLAQEIMVSGVTSSFGIQVDAGVGAKETDVVGIADPVTDFLVQCLNLFTEDISGLFADIGDADKIHRRRTGP